MREASLLSVVIRVIQFTQCVCQLPVATSIFTTDCGLRRRRRFFPRESTLALALAEVRVVPLRCSAGGAPPLPPPPAEAPRQQRPVAATAVAAVAAAVQGSSAVGAAATAIADVDAVLDAEVRVSDGSMAAAAAAAAAAAEIAPLPAAANDDAAGRRKSRSATSDATSRAGLIAMLAQSTCCTPPTPSRAYSSRSMHAPSLPSSSRVRCCCSAA